MLAIAAAIRARHARPVTVRMVTSHYILAAQTGSAGELESWLKCSVGMVLSLVRRSRRDVSSSLQIWNDAYYHIEGVEEREEGGVGA
jgi:hypothetical protein